MEKCGYTQKEVEEIVSFHFSIQMYEERNKDINNVSVETI